MRGGRFQVIDNFYQDPLAVRELARTVEYHPEGDLRKKFPGEESTADYFSDALIEKFSRALGKEVLVDRTRNAFGRFRYARKADVRPTQVHYDDTDYTAVVYLSLDRDCRGGTQFFRHRETGLDGPPSAQWLSERRLTHQEFDAQIVLRDTLNSQKWELVEQCDMRFNRCVLLKGRDYFHGADHIFGDSFEDARLTQNFFFNVR